MLRIVSVIIGSALLLASYLQPPSAKDFRRPIALDKISSGDLYVLDMSGTVFRIAVASNGLSIVGSFDLPVFSYPSDLVSAKLFGQPTLFVTSNTQKFDSLSQYSLEGRLQHTWLFNNGVAGSDVDFNDHVIYVANSDRPEIYQVRLQAEQYKDFSFVAEILGASRLGPLVCDVSRKKLIVGDIDSGTLFEFDIQSHKSRVLADGFSSPQGLLLSPDASLLYIADSSRRKIYMLNLQAGKSTPRVFSAIPDFRSPSGIARLEDGRIVVADDRAGAIFVLASNGTLQSTLHQ